MASQNIEQNLRERIDVKGSQSGIVRPDHVYVSSDGGSLLELHSLWREGERQEFVKRLNKIFETFSLPAVASVYGHELNDRTSWFAKCQDGSWFIVCRREDQLSIYDVRRVIGNHTVKVINIEPVSRLSGTASPYHRVITENGRSVLVHIGNDVRSYHVIGEEEVHQTFVTYVSDSGGIIAEVVLKGRCEENVVFSPEGEVEFFKTPLDRKKEALPGCLIGLPEYVYDSHGVVRIIEVRETLESPTGDIWQVVRAHHQSEGVINYGILRTRKDGTKEIFSEFEDGLHRISVIEMIDGFHACPNVHVSPNGDLHFIAYVSLYCDDRDRKLPIRIPLDGDMQLFHQLEGKKIHVAYSPNMLASGTYWFIAVLDRHLMVRLNHQGKPKVLSEIGGQPVKVTGYPVKSPSGNSLWVTMEFPDGSKVPVEIQDDGGTSDDIDYDKVIVHRQLTMVDGKRIVAWTLEKCVSSGVLCSVKTEDGIEFPVILTEDGQAVSYSRVDGLDIKAPRAYRISQTGDIGFIATTTGGEEYPGVITSAREARLVTEVDGVKIRRVHDLGVSPNGEILWRVQKTEDGLEGVLLRDRDGNFFLLHEVDGKGIKEVNLHPLNAFSFVVTKDGSIWFTAELPDGYDVIVLRLTPEKHLVSYFREEKITWIEELRVEDGRVSVLAECRESEDKVWIDAEWESS